MEKIIHGNVNSAKTVFTFDAILITTYRLVPMGKLHLQYLIYKWESCVFLLSPKIRANKIFMMTNDHRAPQL